MTPQELIERLEDEASDLAHAIAELKADETKIENQHWLESVGSIGYRLNDIALEVQG